MITLDNFDLTPRQRKIFEDLGWTRDRNLVLNLEKYKFLSRKEIISRLNREGREVTEFFSEEYSRYVDFLALEREFGVCIFRTYDSILVVKDMFYDVDFERLLVRLPYQNVEIISVTPYNFSELFGEEDGWNYTVLMFRLVMECMKRNGTDIHISVGHNIHGKPEYYVKFRVANDMEICDLFDINEEMNNRLIHELIQKNTNAFSGDLSTIYGVTTGISDFFGDGKVSLRISANKVLGGFHCVCRIQEYSTTSLKIHQLGFPEEVQEDLYRVSRKVGGFTFITGGIRTGKNTTAFALANEMGLRPISMIDYSSPVEVLMPFPQVDYSDRINHLEELTRLSKKQDINVAFINEIPNKDVARAMRDLVNSSVHVITTFHINRIWHLPHKLEEYFGSGFKNIITQINMCITQRMFKKLCPHCRAQVAVSNEKPYYRELLDRFSVKWYYRSSGCSKCQGDNKEVIIQPYVERLYFTDDLISSLLAAKETYEMEMIIKERVNSTNACLEYYVCKSISEGDLSLDSLDSLL